MRVVPITCPVADTVLSTVALSDFSGQVVRILDDETLEVLHNRSGIDCPEKGQAPTKG